MGNAIFIEDVPISLRRIKASHKSSIVLNLNKPPPMKNQFSGDSNYPTFELSFYGDELTQINPGVKGKRGHVVCYSEKNTLSHKVQLFLAQLGVQEVVLFVTNMQDLHPFKVLVRKTNK